MVRIEVQLRPEEAAQVLRACDVFAGSAEATLRGDQPDRPPAPASPRRFHDASFAMPA